MKGTVIVTPDSGASCRMIGQAAGLGDLLEMLDHALLVGLEQRAVIGRHHHQHLGAGVGCGLGALGGDAGREMRGRDDDRHAPRDLLQREPHDLIALLVGEQELLREIGEDADAVDSPGRPSDP
jgi:hypothetical protein